MVQLEDQQGFFLLLNPSMGLREILYFVLRSFPAVFIKVKRDFTEIAGAI